MSTPNDHAIASAVEQIYDEVGQMRHDLGEMHADLKRRLDGNTLVRNLLAGRVYKLQERVEQLERN